MTDYLASCHNDQIAGLCESCLISEAARRAGDVCTADCFALNAAMFERCAAITADLLALDVYLS